MPGGPRAGAGASCERSPQSWRPGLRPVTRPTAGPTAGWSAWTPSRLLLRTRSSWPWPHRDRKDADRLVSRRPMARECLPSQTTQAVSGHRLGASAGQRPAGRDAVYAEVCRIVTVRRCTFGAAAASLARSVTPELAATVVGGKYFADWERPDQHALLLATVTHYSPARMRAGPPTTGLRAGAS